MDNPIRKPTEREQATLERGRKKIREGSKASTDVISKFLPTYKYQAGNDMKIGQEILDRVPMRARNYDAYQDMTYMKKGGSVSSASKRADGCAQRGKTQGKFV